MDRRRFLKSVALGGAGAAILGRTGGLFAQSGGQPVQAKEGEIRISDVKTHNTGRLIVEVTTDANITGWGEVNVVPAELSEPVVKAYRKLLTGVNPTRIEHIWQMLYRAHRNVRGGAIHVAALAGVDIALWDILGKMAKVPVYTLLGGPCRQKIRHYPSPKAWKQTGHTLMDMIETPAQIDRWAADILKAREKVGKDGYLMADGHGKFTAQAAIQLCRKIEKADLMYFEEVVPPENNEDLIRVKRATTVPLAAGERMSTIWPFRPLFENKCVDVLNPDVVSIGGISQLKKLASIAEMYDIPIAPHGTHSAIGTAASLHVDASVNNFLIQECYEHIANSAAYLSKLTWSKGAFLPLPDGPGLGVTVNRDALQQAVAKRSEKGSKGIGKAYFLNDGSVADR
ncbi:MAG: mandelate racemase/muconate lactonizing enzyme family protein [Phycisphaerae bacterium]